MKSLGQLAWEVYAEAVGGTTYDGKPLPTWDQLGDRQRNAWDVVAETIRIKSL